MNPERQTLIGRSLGDRYKLLQHLGSGGMGDVYLAEHILLGKKVAVKILKDDFSHNEEWVTRFQQEAIAASRIGQENIVDVTDIGRTPEGALYFVMEALDGLNLKSLLMREGSVPLPRALPILIQVTRALGAAHAQGIVHRDLKAENVMVVKRDDGSDFVKILDFGISKVAAVDEAALKQEKRLTRVGALMGTPDYMAPEQVTGEGIDHRVDIYAFGVLAFEIVTGTVPFEAPSAMGVLMKHMTELPQAPSKRRPDLQLPATFDGFVLRALEKDAGRRYQSMGEAREGLLLCCEETGITQFTPPPRPVGAHVSGQTAPAAFARTRVSAKDFQDVPWGGKPKRPWLRAVLAVVAVAAVGAGGFAAARAFQQPPPAPPPPPIVVAPALPPPPPPPVVPAPPPPPDPVTPPVVADHPAKPPPHPVAPPKPGPLTLPEIRAAMGGAQARLLSCLRTYPNLWPEGKGVLTVSINVRPAGTVAEARVSSPKVDAPLEACLVSKVKGVHFPPHTELSQFDLPMAYDRHNN